MGPRRLGVYRQPPALADAFLSSLPESARRIHLRYLMRPRRPVLARGPHQQLDLTVAAPARGACHVSMSHRDHDPRANSTRTRQPPTSAHHPRAEIVNMQ